MTLKELKSKIESGIYPFDATNSILIFTYADTKFLAEQYARKIAENANLKLHRVYTVDDLPSADMFEFMSSDTIYFLDIDILDQFSAISELAEALVPIICLSKKVDKVCPFPIIELPKLLEWQVEDYVKISLSGLTEDNCKWLCKVTNYNIDRLSQEIKKLQLFTPKTQVLLFNEMLRDGGYSDLSYLTIFNLTEAVVKKDIKAIAEVLKARDQLDLEPAGFVTILLKRYKKLIDVKTTSAWSDKLEMSQKQYNYLKFNDCKLYSENTLVKLYEMLTSIDFMLKSGQLEYNRIIDYIITHIFSY